MEGWGNIVNKKTIIVFIVISCSIGLFFLLNYTNAGYRLECGNYSNEDLIKEAIKIQYRGGDKKELERIFTSDFIKQIDSNTNFYKKKIFYSVEKNFMKSFKELDENQFKVSVSVEDSSGSYIQIITLAKDSNDKYLISNIEFDI